MKRKLTIKNILKENTYEGSFFLLVVISFGISILPIFMIGIGFGVIIFMFVFLLGFGAWGNSLWSFK